MKTYNYYEIEPNDGSVIGNSSGTLPVDKNNKFNGRLIVYDERELRPMQHYVYDFNKKKIVKRSDKEISDYEKAREERKSRSELEAQEKKNRINLKTSIINNENKTDKEKLNALIEILKEKKIIEGE